MQVEYSLHIKLTNNPVTKCYFLSKVLSLLVSKVGDFSRIAAGNKLSNPEDISAQDSLLYPGSDINTLVLVIKSLILLIYFWAVN